ncbi:hypothetical protein K505DRAFT_366863 [Melanomma pulvis-pyrius CBS 109.77]|uniref:F-box domain-containing protein n=1 Tax=Melanomma pulvis-pyrius CBS 109.77 TaxID=1314802 RepID=A0A6A6WVQ6_9PLEO|nr:hypothetical protein K505DRAFT_366863 [Melanomma pulvis-pyrius CBS 109.77]
MAKRKRTKPQMRQLQLGVTPDNSLVVVGGKRYMKQPWPYEVDLELFAHLPFSDCTGDEIYRALNPPFRILDLPVELIDEILSLAYIAECNRGPRHNAGARFCPGKSLLPVCKLFYRLIIARMYSHIHLRDYPDSHNAVPIETKLLIRCLEETPSLARHCTNLNIHSYATASLVSSKIDGFMPNLTNLRSLGISVFFNPDDGMSEYILSLLKRSLPHLARVDKFLLVMEMSDGAIEDWSDDATEDWPEETQQPIPEFCGIIDVLRNLKYLEIHGLNLTNDIPKSLKGSSPITSLILKNYRGDSAGLNEFLQWPGNLEHFALMDTPASTQCYLYDLGTALFSHRHSLKSLEFGNVL